MSTFNIKKYLSIARDNFTISKINDIGEIDEGIMYRQQWLVSETSDERAARLQHDIDSHNN